MAIAIVHRDVTGGGGARLQFGVIAGHGHRQFGELLDGDLAADGARIAAAERCGQSGGRSMLGGEADRDDGQAID